MVLQSFDYDVTGFEKILFLKNWLHYFEYYIWYIAFIESYYFICTEKTVEQIYRNMCLLMRPLFKMAYLSVENILFYI